MLSFKEQIALALASGLTHACYNTCSEKVLPSILASGLFGPRALTVHGALSQTEKRKFLNYWTSLLHSSVVSGMFICGLPTWFAADALSADALLDFEIPLSDFIFPISCGYFC